MEGLARASGAGSLVIRLPRAFRGTGQPATQEEGFDEFTLPPMRVEDYAIVEQHLAKNRVSPVDAVLPEIERLGKMKSRAARMLAKQLADKAYNDLRKSREELKVTLDDVQAYIDRPEGMLFTMKLCMGRVHPNITEEDVRRVFDWLGEAEARRLRDLAQGVDALGNSIGRGAEGPATPATAETVSAPGRSTGEGFTGSSQPSTVGLPTG